MGSLLVVTGPPGAGKSTVCALLADRFERSILVEGDRFFDFLAAGAIEPWLPESNEQNHVVTAAGARATARFADDYDVVYDGVVGPWLLDVFMREGGLTELDYAVILPPVETCISRIATREGHGFTDADAGRHMHGEFANADIETRHVIEIVTDTAGDTADAIVERRRTGLLRVER